MQTYRARQFKSLLTRLWQQSLLSDEFIQATVDLVARTLGTDVAALLAYDGRADELLLVGTRGLARSGVGFVTMKLGQSMSGMAAKELRPFYTSDVRTDPCYVSAPTLDQDRYLSLLSVPVVLDDRLVGVLSVQTVDSRQYGPKDIKELSEIAAEVGPYLDELWRRDLAGRLRGPSAISRLEGFLANDPEPVEVALQLAEQLQIVFPVRRSTVVLPNAEGGVSFYGDAPDDDAQESLRLAMRSCLPQTRIDERSGITVSICSASRPLGAIHIALAEGSPEPLSSAASQVLQSFAQLAGKALSQTGKGRPTETTAKERAYEELTQMVLDEAGFEALMARAAELCRGPVAVTDRLGGLVAGTLPVTALTNLPLKAGDTIMGRLLAAAPIETTHSIQAAAHAVAMELSKWNLRFEVERELRGDALDALLAGTADPAETSMRAHLLGIDSKRTYFTVVFNLDISHLAESRGSIFLRSLMNTIQRGLGGSPATLSFVKQYGLLVFVDKARLGQPPRATVAKVLESLRSSAPGFAISVGIGPDVTGPSLYAQSIRLARLAADLGHQIGSSVPVDASQIGAYRLLIGVEGSDRLQEFVDEYLGELVDYDSRRGTQFVRTLEAYHASGEKLRPTADSLFIHVNTLKHRIERIAAITGRDLELVSERFNLYLALYALRLLKPGRSSLLPSVLAPDA